MSLLTLGLLVFCLTCQWAVVGVVTGRFTY